MTTTTDTLIEVREPAPAATPQTESFVETKKKRGHVFETLVTVERTPASIGDLDSGSRFYQTCGDAIRIVRKVHVWRQSMFDGGRLSPEDRGPHDGQHGFEIVFACGAVGYLPADYENEDLIALVADFKGYLAGLWCGRKYGMQRGPAVAWMFAQRSKRARQNADRVPTTCIAELYARANGQPWGCQ
jgi:hypothetical protein